MRRRFLLVTWLTVLWLALWREVSVANLAAGFAVALMVTTGSMAPRFSPVRHSVSPLALLRFLGYFCWKLLEANVVLAREVVTPTNDIHTGIVAVPMPGDSDLVTTIVANAVSLTPGTLTLEVWRRPEPVLYVHVLHLHDVDVARAEVERMATYARAAFPQRGPEPSEVRG